MLIKGFPVGVCNANSFADRMYKSHDSLVLYPTMHHFETEMCTWEHISVTEWCIVGYLSNALWQLWDVFNRPRLPSLVVLVGKWHDHHIAVPKKLYWIIWVCQTKTKPNHNKTQALCFIFRTSFISHLPLTTINGCLQSVKVFTNLSALTSQSSALWIPYLYFDCMRNFVRGRYAVTKTTH